MLTNIFKYIILTSVLFGGLQANNIYANNHYFNHVITLEKAINTLSNKLLSSSRVDQSTLDDIALTAFVNLNKFSETSNLGRILSESMFNELLIRNYNIVEFRGQSNISIDNNGEYFISRDTTRLKKIIENKYILVGTYTTYKNTILINARIIENKNGKVVATARVHQYIDDCELTNSCKPYVVSNKEKEKVSIVSERKLRVSASKPL